MNKFVFTCGDINGIGPEIVIKAVNRIIKRKQKKLLYYIVPKNVFQKSIELTQAEFEFKLLNGSENGEEGKLNIIDIEGGRITPGRATEESGRTAYKAIELSYKLLAGKTADAVITAPISKTAIDLAGINFPGHTEMYAEWSGVKDFVMVFLSKKMNAALATIHVPIRKVPRMITEKRLSGVIDVVIKMLKEDLKIDNPSLGILGLNPHAGEGGLIGEEERDIILPLIEDMYMGYNISGPFSPDAFFANKTYKEFDIVIGMYHDQVLIPFKLMNFASGVNYTAGLPIVRTSPDHGTAYDIAWTNKAEETSIYEAFLYAEMIVKNRKKAAIGE